MRRTVVMIYWHIIYNIPIYHEKNCIEINMSILKVSCGNIVSNVVCVDIISLLQVLALVTPWLLFLTRSGVISLITRVSNMAEPSNQKTIQLSQYSIIYNLTV